MKYIKYYEAYSNNKNNTYYHGSPFLFKRFEINTTEKGEGWNAYGKGVYLTANKDTAYKYADNSKYHYFNIDGIKYNNVFISANNLVGSYTDKKFLIEDVKHILDVYKKEIKKYPSNKLSIIYKDTYIPLGEEFLDIVENAKLIEVVVDGYVYTVKLKPNLKFFRTDETDLDAINFFKNLYKVKVKTNDDIIGEMSSNTEKANLFTAFLAEKGYHGISIKDSWIVVVFDPKNITIKNVEKVF